MNAATLRIESVEALARWTHPVKGEIAADIFIPIAEEAGLIGELSRQVLRKACNAARDWPCNLSINLSAAQFWDHAVVSGLLAVIQECDFPATRLEFEITETYLLRNPEVSADLGVASERGNGDWLRRGWMCLLGLIGSLVALCIGAWASRHWARWL